MGKVARILLIITIILSFASILAGFILFAVFTNLASNEAFINMAEKVLLNYGIINADGSSTILGTSSVAETLNAFPSILLVLGFMNLPLAIASIRAVKDATKGRLIGVIICGAICFNIFGIIVGILNLIAFNRHGYTYYY